MHGTGKARKTGGLKHHLRSQRLDSGNHLLSASLMSRRGRFSHKLHDGLGAAASTIYAHIPAPYAPRQIFQKLPQALQPCLASGGCVFSLYCCSGCCVLRSLALLQAMLQRSRGIQNLQIICITTEKVKVS